MKSIFETMCVGRILLKCEGECWFMGYSLLYRAVVFGAIFKSPKIVFSVQWEEIVDTIPVFYPVDYHCPFLDGERHGLK